MVTFTDPMERVVLDWETRHVDPRDRSRVDVRVARAVLTHVWAVLGMPCNPPVLTSLRPQDAGYVLGALAFVDADGTHIVMQKPELATSVILHEIAHCMTDDPLGSMEHRRPVEREMHGPLWLTNYLWLLDRFMGPVYNTFHMRATLPPQTDGWSIPFHPIVWGKARVIK